MTISELDRLLRMMEPKLDPREWVYVTGEIPEAILARAFAVFREEEGTAAIVESSEAAAAGLDGAFRSRLITLGVFSDLESIGFLAAVSTELALHGIPTNVVSAFHHDHLFVPADAGLRTVELLLELSRR